MTESAWGVIRLPGCQNDPLIDFLSTCELLTGFLDRLKRTVSNIANSGSGLNPFCRLRKGHRQKVLARPVARQATRNIGDLEDGQVSSFHSKKESSGNRTVWGQVRTALFNRWINLLLVCVPVGIVTRYIGVNG